MLLTGKLSVATTASAYIKRTCYSDHESYEPERNVRSIIHIIVISLHNILLLILYIEDKKNIIIL